MNIFFLSLVPALALIFYSFLVLVTWRHGLEDKVNQRFILYLLSMMIWSLGALMMYLDRSRAPAWNRLMMTGVVVMPLAFYGFVHAFRREAIFDRILKIGVLVCGVFLILAVKGYMAGDINITEQGLIEFALGRAIPYFAIYFAFLLGYSALILIRGIRETKDYVQKNRYRYVLTGLIVILAGGLTNSVGHLGAYPLDIMANTWNAILLAYTIFRYQLLDISLVVRKGLMYTVPTVIVGMGYLLLIYLTVNIFDTVTGYQTLLVSVILAMIVALIMQPAQERMQQWIDRMFFREKYNANLMLQRVSRTAATILNLERLTEMMLNELASTVHTSRAALFLRDQASGVYELVAEHGLPDHDDMFLRPDHPVVEHLSHVKDVQTLVDVELTPRFKALWARERRDLDTIGAVLFVPLLAQGELMGLLIVGPKLSGITYTTDEQLMLSTLANQTAIAVQNAWLYQQALEEKQRAEIILEQAFTGIVLVDADLQIVDMNLAAVKIVGYDRQELLGQSIVRIFSELVHADDSALRQAFETGQAMEPQEAVLNGRNGRRDVLLGMTPVQDHFLLNFMDITQIKELARLQANIVANVSHELRTPLSSIKGYADLLLHGADRLTDEMRQQCLAIIDSEADRMTRVVNTLLDLSKLESGRAELALEEIDLQALLEEVVTAMELQARKAGIRMLCEVEPTLPPVTANRDMMLSILKNLLSNAVKYSLHGGRVWVRIHREAEHLLIEVRDEGLGIPEEDLPHLFTKFYRSRRAHDAGVRGTGLGLALVKDAVEAHKGTVDVQSKLGEGTTFTVRLPWQVLAPRPENEQDQYVFQQEP